MNVTHTSTFKISDIDTLRKTYWRRIHGDFPVCSLKETEVSTVVEFGDTDGKCTIVALHNSGLMEILLENASKAIVEKILFLDWGRDDKGRYVDGIEVLIPGIKDRLKDVDLPIAAFDSYLINNHQEELIARMFVSETVSSNEDMVYPKFIGKSKEESYGYCDFHEKSIDACIEELQEKIDKLKAFKEKYVISQ